MNETEIYAFLENTFIATFRDELIPGIFHNFANPLNGIMGRSKLMQRRLVDFVGKMESRYPGIEREMGEGYKKIISDVHAINSESDKLFDMFRVSTGKYYAIGTHVVDKLNVSSLIEAEMGFADFYLDFKHNVRKDIRLDREAPEISGITAFYSMIFWMLIRHAMKNINNENDKTFFVATSHDDRYVTVEITHIDHGMFPGWQDMSSNMNETLDIAETWNDEQKKVYYPLLLLKMGDEGVKIAHDDGADLLTIRIPHQHKKREA